ncbi:MAG: hypothetical protein V4805_06445 [Pseudomonadota bacterium]
MSGIVSISQIVATLRAEMASRVKADTASRVAHKRDTSKSDMAKAAQGTQIDSLIAQRVKALDPDDPKRGRKAFRIFLESVLLAQFGDALINDPTFYQMVDEIQHVMEQDPQIATAMNQAAENLLDVYGIS